MTILWNETSAAEATGGKAHGAWQATRVEIDSRKVKNGDLFVALKGENFDGHDYVKDALDKGAVAALVSRIPAGLESSPLLVVDDTLKGLEALGKDARKRSSARVIGVTGSVGKTSTKEMIRIALSAHGETYATSGNYNNHIGTPLNLANLPPSARFAVFEMGMNHSGEISHLTHMVKPHIAAITTVEAVHMEFFGSMEAIADAKSEIFEDMPKGGIAILNRDSPLYAYMLKKAGAHGVHISVTFGTHEKADCRLVEYRPLESGCTVSASIHGRHISYTMQAVGKHWAVTSLLTLAVTHALGLDDEKTAAALASFGELDGRGRVVPVPVAGGRAILVDDSYNASPAAMAAAFAKTAEVWESMGRKGRRLAALGNMLELGADAPLLHSGLARDIQQHGFDKVFTSGELMKHLHDALPPGLRAGQVAQAMQLLPLIEKELRAGDVLLLKGSHGSKIYELAKALLDKAAAPAAMEKRHAV
jgi:UDP-N-acetylmuramoyl-tripeptide--D-alanyl-D-alanine ligase